MHITLQTVVLQAISLIRGHRRPIINLPLTVWFVSQIKLGLGVFGYYSFITDHLAGVFMLTENQLLEFKMRLKERFFDVREEIRLELLRSDNQHFIDLAGQVHDLEEQSVADLLVDIDLAILDMHIEEIRDIDASLIRIAQGSYGVCEECETAIANERLRAFITAKRCTACQAVFERTHAGPVSHTL